jgi:hypothetical protein
MSSQEDPEENATADDEPAAGEAEEPENRAPETPDGDAGGSGDDDDHRPPTEDERIEQLTDRIEKARTQAEEAGVLVDDDAEEYVDSGVTEEEDDQTITPPG